MSYTKILRPFHDAGHHLDLLSGAGMLTGLPKYASKVMRSRGLSPKLQVFNTALITDQSGMLPDEVRADREFGGRLVESAVGAHLANAAARGLCELDYWRERNRDMDFVIRAGRILVAVEVKRRRSPHILPGLAAFSGAFEPRRTLFVSGDGVPLDESLLKPVDHWRQA